MEYDSPTKQGFFSCLMYGSCCFWMIDCYLTYPPCEVLVLEQCESKLLRVSHPTSFNNIILDSGN